MRHDHSAGHYADHDHDDQSGYEAATLRLSPGVADDLEFRVGGIVHLARSLSDPNR